MTLTCPGCGKTFAPPPSAAGHTIRCGCGASFAVPPPLPANAPAPPSQREPTSDGPRPQTGRAVAFVVAVVAALGAASAARDNYRSADEYRAAHGIFFDYSREISHHRTNGAALVVMSLASWAAAVAIVVASGGLPRFASDARTDAHNPVERPIAWGWRNFQSLGPWGRPAFAAGLVGGAIAVACVALWFLATAGLDRADVRGADWHIYRTTGAAPRALKGSFAVMRLAEVGVWFGAGVALVGLVTALLNANREPTPPHVRPPIAAAVAGLVVSLLFAFVLLIL